MPTKVSRNNAVARIRIVDSTTKERYFLVRADIFEQLHGIAENLDPCDTYHFVDDVMREDDMLDPALAAYQQDRFTTHAP